MSNKELRIEQLLEKEIFKLPDGRDLYEGTEGELTQLLEEKESNRMEKELLPKSSREK